MDATVELAATCNALGFFDVANDKYYADENTLETVKDLIRYLRRDDANHEIRRYLGQSKVVVTDLLPLLKSYWEQTELFDLLLRLLVNLTTPAISLWNDELPEDRITRHYYLQIEGQLTEYKAAFADDAIWSRLSMRMSKILETDYAERGDANGLIVERILVLVRNVLLIGSDPHTETRLDNDANTHDKVLWSLHQSGMLDILLYIVSSENEQAYHLYCLEIFSYMLGEMNPTVLAQATLQRNQLEKMQDEAELLAIRHREQLERQERMKKYTGARHSRFGGTYVVKSMKSISDNDLIYHRPLNNLDQLNFDIGKSKPKTPKNRLPIKEKKCERRSTISVRLFLKEFCIDFLNGAYNTVMHHVKDSLSRGRHQDDDETIYLWVLKFFMEFNRNYKFEVKLVSETVSVQIFHYVQQQMEHHFDMLSSDKKKVRLWSSRLHRALLAYRELLLTLTAMDKSADESVRKSATVIKSNIFYVLEYREFILTMLVTFDEIKMSNLYLNDLLETQHIFLKMFESYCGKDKKIFQTIKKSRKKSKKGKSSAEAALEPEMDVESQWEDIAPQLSAILQEGSGAVIPVDVLPYDSTLETPVEEQRPMAMVKIQNLFRDHEFEKGIAYLRASREVWPENDAFGAMDIAPEEEFLAIKDIFFAKLQDDSQPRKSQPIQQPSVPDNEEEEEDEEDDDGNDMDITETNFKFDDFVKRFCHPKIVRACSLSLAYFDKNSVFTNHCIVKLLHRIAFNCTMSTMVFQVSIFRIFQRIFVQRALPQYKELCQFATFIIRQFIKIAAENDLVYMEALFWKSSKDACDIEDGYQGNNQKSAAAAKAWTELEEDELRRLFVEHQENQIEEDVVDWLLKNLIDHTRTRRGVMKKLKEMYLLTNYKPRKSGPATSGRNQKNWTEDEESQLGELFEQFKDAMDPLTCIMDRLDVPRPKNRIIEKLLIMGLIQDRKEVRKKRSKKSASKDNQKSGASNRLPRTSGLDSDLESCSSSSGASDDEDGDRGRRNASSKGASSVKKYKKPPQKKSGPALKLPTSAEAFRLLSETIEQGMSEALEWLRESLTEAADDLDIDVDDGEGIPLVPLLEPSLTAMESPTFQSLLRAVGIKEPADEQETYWRISGQLSLKQLRSICQNITDALEGRLPNPVDIEEPSTSASNSEKPPADVSSDDEDIFDRIKKIMGQPDEEVASVASSSGKSIRRKDSSSSIASSAASSRLTQSQKSTPKAKGKNKPKNMVVDSSSEDESTRGLSQKSSGSVKSSQNTNQRSSSDSSDIEARSRGSQSSAASLKTSVKKTGKQISSPKSSQSTAKSSQSSPNSQSSQSRMGSSQRSSRMLTSDSSDVEAEADSTVLAEKQTPKKLPSTLKKKKKRIAAFVDSEDDSDKENDVTLVLSPDSSDKENENLGFEDSSVLDSTKSQDSVTGLRNETDLELGKRSRVLDSDSNSDGESNGSGPKVKRTKIVRVVQSDGDSD